MRDTNLKTLIVRAVVVTLAVLLALILLRHFGILTVESDSPQLSAIAVTDHFLF